MIKESIDENIIIKFEIIMGVYLLAKIIYMEGFLNRQLYLFFQKANHLFILCVGTLQYQRSNWTVDIQIKTRFYLASASPHQIIGRVHSISTMLMCQAI